MNNSLLEISETGNDLETLRALRRKVAVTLDECKSARDIAALSRQLQSIVAKITEIESSGQETEMDLIIAKYKGRSVRDHRRRSSFTEVEVDE